MAEPTRPLPIQAVPAREGELSAATREAHLPAAPSSDRMLEDEIDLWHYARVFGRHWVLLMVVATLCAISAFILTRFQPVVYEGETTLIVLPAASDALRGNPASFRVLIQNFGLAKDIVRELGLDKPPDRLTPMTFLDRALTVQEAAGTNIVRVKVRLSDPTRAAEAARLLAERSVALNERIGAGESASMRNQMKAHLDEAAQRLKTAETELLAFQREAQVDLLKSEADAILDERGELLRLVISIESEKARLAAAEREIARQQPLLSVKRAPEAEEALRQTAEIANQAEALEQQLRDQRSVNRRTERSEQDRDQPVQQRRPVEQNIPPTGALDLSNPVVNPVYQTLDFQIANSRSRLAALERQRRELVDVKKLGGSELPQLSELYRRQIELARLETTHDLAKKVYGDMAVRYEETRMEALSRTAQLQVVDPAIVPDRPVSRKGAQSAVVGFAIGLMLAGIAALVLENRQSTS